MNKSTDKNDLYTMLNKCGYTEQDVLILDAPGSVTDILLMKYHYIISLISLHDGGHHWICFYGGLSHFAHIFDSYGLDPEHNSFYDIREVLRDPRILVKKPSNYTGFQAPGTAVCGEYCVAFILCHGSVPEMKKKIGLRDVHDNQILNNYGSSKFKQATQQAFVNDENVLSFINKQCKQ